MLTASSVGLVSRLQSTPDLRRPVGGFSRCRQAGGMAAATCPRRKEQNERIPESIRLRTPPTFLTGDVAPAGKAKFYERPAWYFPSRPMRRCSTPVQVRNDLNAHHAETSVQAPSGAR